MKQNREEVRNFGAANHRGVNLRGVNLLIDTSSGAACFLALSEGCGNREIATPIATPVATPVGVPNA